VDIKKVLAFEINDELFKLAMEVNPRHGSIDDAEHFVRTGDYQQKKWFRWETRPLASDSDSRPDSSNVPATAETTKVNYNVLKTVNGMNKSDGLSLKSTRAAALEGNAVEADLRKAQQENVIVRNAI
jgi:hypothetical protein